LKQGSVELGRYGRGDEFFHLVVQESVGVHCGALYADLLSRRDMPSTPSFADGLKCVLAGVIGDSDLNNNDRELSR
jgi:hypothetical protein